MRVDYNVLIILYCVFHTQHCCDSMTMWRCHLFWSNFHRNSLERGVITVPVIPNKPCAGNSVCGEVQSIQVWIVTFVVPPASLVGLCTITSARLLIVCIPRAERHAVIIAERITWNTNNVTNTSESSTLHQKCQQWWFQLFIGITPQLQTSSYGELSCTLSSH